MRGAGHERGFSMIEMLVSMALFGVVLSMVFVFLDQARKNLETESGGIETQQGARIALEEIGWHVNQAGLGIARTGSAHVADWQRAIVHAGAHALAFNADLDPSIGAMSDSSRLDFPDGSSYEGEGPGNSTDGAETYYFGIDANGDGRITAADRRLAAGGSRNPASATSNPLDYAVVRRVLGYDGTEDGGQVQPITPHLFTNATAADRFGDGTTPAPLFAYWLTEDLDGDDTLDPWECVVAPCPPAGTRKPQTYLWGDDDFDGVLSEAEKTRSRNLPVGHPSWQPNPLSSGGAFHEARINEAAAIGEATLEVDDASGFAPGFHLTIGQGSTLERAVVRSVDTGPPPNRIHLTSGLRYEQDRGAHVAVRPETLYRAIRTVQVSFGAITPDRDYDSAVSAAAPGRAHRIGTRGLDYRVYPFERRFGLPNLKTGGGAS